MNLFKVRAFDFKRGHASTTKEVETRDALLEFTAVRIFGNALVRWYASKVGIGNINLVTLLSVTHNY